MRVFGLKNYAGGMIFSFQCAVGYRKTKSLGRQAIADCEAICVLSGVEEKKTFFTLEKCLFFIDINS